MVKHVLLADKLKSLAFNPYIQNWYRKIPKISPSKYSPPPPGGGGLSLEIALKYKIKERKTVNFLPRIRLAQSILKRKFPSVLS